MLWDGGVNYKNGEIDIIEHTGETSNYHAHAVINPQEKIGVIEMDNVGGFITAGQIGPGVLKLALNKQPSLSKNLRVIILIINMIYLIIAVLLIISFLRLRHFKKRMAKSKYRFAFNLIFTSLVNLLLPILVLIKAPVLLGATWKATIIFSPDISLVLISVQVVLFIIGMLKAAMIISVIKSINKKKKKYNCGAFTE